uniref:Homeobox domain-containing protein n=1 Tax=Macrostomum lignano TaxID=282301 RepID=A0A1I8F399_9PLAT
MEGTPSFVQFNRPFHYADAAPASSSVASTSATASAPVLALQETPKATLPRRRANLTAVQRRELERMFELQKYPDYRELELLSRTIGIPYRKVLIWFKNRRAKDRRVRKVDYGPHDFIASSAASAAAAAAAAAASGPSYFQSPKSPMQLQQHYQQQHHISSSSSSSSAVVFFLLRFDIVPESSASRQQLSAPATRNVCQSANAGIFHSESFQFGASCIVFSAFQPIRIP